MATDHEKELRDVAQRARAAADLISQGPVDQFQSVVRSELPAPGRDHALQDVERKLLSVAAAIETYLRR